MAGLVTELASEPPPKQKRKYNKRVKATSSDATNELVRLAILTAINTTTNTIFNCVAIFAKDNKWKLEQDESLQLAQDLDAALVLLPEKQYEVIIQYLSTISPLAALATTLTGIIKKRFDANKTVVPNTGKSDSSNPVSSSSKSPDITGDWRFNPAFAITGVNQ